MEVLSMGFSYDYYNTLKGQNIFFFVKTDGDERKRNKYVGF